MSFTKAQENAINARGRTLLVCAAAGSGKTYTLTHRIIKAITEEKRNIDRMLIVTFTRAAAGELRVKIAKAIRISRKCMGIVYQNILFAIGIKVLALVLVALGAANMWLAIFADVGVMILAVLNAIRALFVRKL